MAQAYVTLIDKLDAFIRKYYKNLLIKGILLSLFCLLILFLLINTLEYVGYFSSLLRLILLLLFLFTFLFTFIFWVIKPLIKIYGFGKIISYEEASKIIAAHFSSIQDQLLNILQLNQLAQLNENELQLIEAGIDQKAENLKAYKFLQAVDFKRNIKYLKWLALPVFVLGFLFLFSPDIITSSTQRVVHFNTFYEKPMPFEITIKNNKLEAAQQDDFVLEIEINGYELPDQVMILQNGFSYKMHKITNRSFSYTFRQVQKEIEFSFIAGGLQTRSYLLKILPKPTIFDFLIMLNYPSYTGKKAENIINTGDLTLPKGTVIKWQIRTNDVDTLDFFCKGKLLKGKQNSGVFVFSQTAMEYFDYTIVPQNKFVINNDTFNYKVTVIEDRHPSIQAIEMSDSVMPFQLFFRGNINDDYGFTSLAFHLLHTNAENPQLRDSLSIPIVVKHSDLQQDFWFAYDFSNFLQHSGDVVEYYFEVFDNNAIDGNQSSKTQLFKRKTYSNDELRTIIEEQSADINKDIKKTLSDIKKMRKEIDKLSQKLIDKKTLSWEERKSFQELSDMQMQMQKNIEEMNKEIKEKFTSEQKLSDYESAILEKQKELEKLFNEVFDEQMKKTLEEIQQLMNEQMNKEQMEKALENIKQNNKQVEKELDRNIEIFKQLELEKKIDEALQSIENIKEKQKELRIKTESNNTPRTIELQQQQNEINKNFKEFQKDLDDINTLNQQLESPKDIKRNKELEKSLSSDLEKAKQKLLEQKEKEASENQKSAEQKLETLQQEMEDMFEEMEAQQDAEDAEMIRRLLKNIVKVSQKQEDLITKTRTVNVDQNEYQIIIKQQSELKDDIGMISDSLYAIGKRQPKVASMIKKELQQVNENTNEALKELLNYNNILYQRGGFKNGMAAAREQYAMTSFNNISLLLA